MFHVNKIYFSRVISTIEGKTKDPGAMQDGALLNCIKSINKPGINNVLPRQSIPVPITNTATLQLKAKVEWFSEQKAKGFQGSFRNDYYLCLLVLAFYLVMDEPDNLNYLLEYKQKEISLIHLSQQHQNFLSLFQRDILLAYRDIDPEIADVALKYFLKHATCWLSPKNVALNVYRETLLITWRPSKFACFLIPLTSNHT